jgi:hypothetical protein
LVGWWQLHADQSDAPQGAVGVAIAAAVQAMPVGAAGGHRDRRDAAQACERTLRAQSAGIVASRDQQLPGGAYSDAGQGNQFGRDYGDQRRELAIQIVDLGSQGLPAAGQGSQRCLGRGRRISQRTRL